MSPLSLCVPINSSWSVTDDQLQESLHCIANQRHPLEHLLVDGPGGPVILRASCAGTWHPSAS